MDSVSCLPGESPLTSVFPADHVTVVFSSSYRIVSRKVPVYALLLTFRYTACKALVLVFVGKNGNHTVGGVWAFMTDSTGKNLLWQNNFKIPYRSADGKAPMPLSVCAMSDTGFTVAGKYNCHDSIGGMNAFAAHFVPSPVAAEKKIPTASSPSTMVRCLVTGGNAVFSFPDQVTVPVRLTVYTVGGKKVFGTVRKMGEKTVVWKPAKVCTGVYCYNV